MLGSSRTSLAAARDELARTVADTDPAAIATLSSELLAVSSAIAGSSALRSALSDSGTASADRTSLARSVFEGKVGATTLEIVADIAARRWTSGRDLVDGIEALGFEAALIEAERTGRLDTVEDELFRVDRLVAGDDDLRHTLSDVAITDDTKAALIEDILGGKADDRTVRLVRHVVAHPRGRRLGDALSDLVAQSARRRERLVANVRVAEALTQEQHSRLAAALGQIYRNEVDLQIEIDPEVLGGSVVTVGDEVIDGSVARRIEQVRRTLGAPR